MEKILNEILSELQAIKADVNELKQGQVELRNDVNELKQGQIELKTDVKELKADVKELNRKTSLIFEQTAGLTEFETTVMSDLKELKKEVSFIGHKEYQNEKDVFDIKKTLEIIK